MTITTLAQTAASSPTNTLILSGVVVQYIVQAAVIGWQVWLNVKVRSIQDIKAENKKQSSELIKTEIASVEQKLIARIERLADSVQGVISRLERGDSKFDTIADQDKKLEMKIMVMTNDLKEYIRETCAGANRVEKIEASVAHLQRQVDQQNRGTL